MCYQWSAILHCDIGIINLHNYNMRHPKILTGAAVTLSCVLLPFSFALAEGNKNGGVSDETQGTASVQIENTTAVGVKSEDNSQERENSNKDDNASSTEDMSSDNENEMEGSSDLSEGERHQKSFENVTHSLRELAGKDTGIGEEIQAIADEQASSSEKIGKAINAVAQRNQLLSFLFGSDFENIGILRSTLAVTQNHIDQLSKVKEKTVSADVQAGIDAQITALEKANAEAEAFVQAHENTFSIFGWFFKMFGAQK